MPGILSGWLEYEIWAALQPHQAQKPLVADNKEKKMPEGKPNLKWTIEALAVVTGTRNLTYTQKATEFAVTRMPECCAYDIIGRFCYSQTAPTDVALAATCMRILQQTSASALLATTVESTLEGAAQSSILETIGFKRVSTTKNKNTTNVVTLWQVDIKR